MKKTKIICSIGPSTQNWENFKGLVDAGMNVARINFSHATMEERRIDEELVMRARKELGANIAILFDTKGPDLRTCEFKDGSIELVAGETIRLVEKDVLGTQEEISFNYKGIIKDLKVGMSVLVDDGFYKLEVESVDENGEFATCRILNGGTIISKRGVCIPGVNLDVPYVSEKDKEDIKYACDHDGDYLAISFVNSAQNIQEVRKLCKEFGKPDMPIVSKVETQYAMDNLEEIVDASDYIMIARGDLGIETGVENLPLYQQMMIDACHKKCKGVIMATQMMHSMKKNIRPTNAEVTDVSNAVLAGCDAIMTSDETTIGNYPVETIQNMNLICQNTEKITKYHLSDYSLKGTEIHNTIAKLAVEASKDLPIKAIVTSTLTGKTAWDISCLRPNAYIIATASDEKVARSLALKWGVYSKVVPQSDDVDEITASGLKAAKEIVDVQDHDYVAIVGGAPAIAHTNFIKIEEV